METPSAVQSPLVVTTSRQGGRRFAAVVLLIVALAVAAFIIGRTTVGTSTPHSIAPGQQSAPTLQLSDCHVGQPC